MNLFDGTSTNADGLTVALLLISVEVVAGLLALRNIRRECGVKRSRSAQTVAAVWACFLIHSLVVVWCAWFAVGALPVDPLWALVLGGVVAAIGALFALAGFWEFRSLQRMSGLSPDRLVTSGIYRLSRNPQNLGWGLLLLGIAIAGRSGLACLMSIAFWIAFRRYVSVEEKHLSWVFSDQWDGYVAETPRFFGLGPVWKAAVAPSRASTAKAKSGVREFSQRRAAKAEAVSNS